MPLNSFALYLERPDAILYRRPGLNVLNIVAIVIAFISVLLRIWARYISTGLRFSKDDWLAFVAFPLSVCLMGQIINLNTLGLGEHTENISYDLQVTILRTDYIGHLLAPVDFALIRFSALAFYSRIFPVHSSSGIVWLRFYWITLSMAIAWPVFIIIFDALVICNPINKYWQLDQPGSCIPRSTIAYIEAVGTLAVNLMTLCKPLPQVFKLKMKWRKKMAVGLSFVLGYGVAFLSLGRMILCLQLGSAIDDDVIFFLLPDYYWVTAEVGFSIPAVCLPAIFQLSRRGRQQGFKSLFQKRHIDSSYVRTGPRSTTTGGLQNCSLRRYDLDWNDIYERPLFGTYVNITAGANSNDPNIARNQDEETLARESSNDMALPLEGINVTHAVTVTRNEAAEMRTMV